MATWRRAQVGQTIRSCDEVSEGLVSRAATVQRRRRARQPSLPKIVIWLSMKLEVSKYTCKAL